MKLGEVTCMYVPVTIQSFKLSTSLCLTLTWVSLGHGSATCCSTICPPERTSSCKHQPEVKHCARTNMQTQIKQIPGVLLTLPGVVVYDTQNTNTCRLSAKWKEKTRQGKKRNQVNVVSGWNLIEVYHSQGNCSERGRMFLSSRWARLKVFFLHLPDGSLVPLLL